MKIQVRDDKVIIDGYVNAVERFSKPLTNKNGKKFIERIMPSVFQRAIEKNDAIKVLLNHNYDMELANTKDGSAKLYEDNIGLRAIVEVSDATVIEKAKQNKLRGWSFGFICNKEDEEINDNGISERTVRDIDLFEVSIIDDRKIPAYIGTSIEMRDGEVKEIEFRYEETESDENTQSEDSVKNENFSSMTASQKRELLNGAYRQTFSNGWLEDYDDYFVYGSIKEDSTLYKMPYTITDGVVSIDTSKQVKVVRGGYKEVRYEETESDENTQSEDSVKNENFSSMTASQKRELLNGAYRQTFSNGWLEDYDDYFVYGSIKEDSTLYKMPYTITDGVVSIDTSKQVKVVRGGYKEVRYEEKPEQQPKQEVEKIDFSEYENRIKKIKEETE